MGTSKFWFCPTCVKNGWDVCSVCRDGDLYRGKPICVGCKYEDTGKDSLYCKLCDVYISDHYKESKP